MGCLPWDPQVTMSTDINLVFMALKGTHERIKLIGKLYHGIKYETPRPAKAKSTADWFKSFAAEHNARFAAKGKV